MPVHVRSVTERVKTYTSEEIDNALAKVTKFIKAVGIM